MEENCVEESPEEVAKFLFETRGLKKASNIFVCNLKIFKKYFPLKFYLSIKILIKFACYILKKISVGTWRLFRRENIIYFGGFGALR